jgi:hypothetical protein
LGRYALNPAVERDQRYISFRAIAYRVMIGSPSDLSEERQAATDAANDWNALHAAKEQVVLLPVKWETLATAQTGIRPQQSISEQMIQSADILIAKLWAKLGIATGIPSSGTVEEIDQFVAASKPNKITFQ